MYIYITPRVTCHRQLPSHRGVRPRLVMVLSPKVPKVDSCGMTISCRGLMRILWWFHGAIGARVPHLCIPKRYSGEVPKYPPINNIDMVDIDDKDHVQIIFQTENHGLNRYRFACFHFRITVADVLQVSFTAGVLRWSKTGASRIQNATNTGINPDSQGIPLKWVLLTLSSLGTPPPHPQNLSYIEYHLKQTKYSVAYILKKITMVNVNIIQYNMYSSYDCIISLGYIGFTNLVYHTVDGRNPASPWMVETL